jgi:hypothetical protein
MSEEEQKTKDDAEFRRCVRYFWEEKRNPRRYGKWDAGRCAELMPAFYEAWFKMEVYRHLADAAMENEAKEPQ